MWIFIFKIYNNIVAQVNSELFKISCADPKKFPGGSEGYFSLLRRSEVSFLYEILLRKYKLEIINSTSRSAHEYNYNFWQKKKTNQTLRTFTLKHCDLLDTNSFKPNFL